MVLINQTRKVSDLWCGEKIIIKAIMKVNIAMQCGPVVQITIKSQLIRFAISIAVYSYCCVHHQINRKKILS